MKFKDFGSTGMRVSEIGFGGSRIGGILAQKQGDPLQVLHKAVDAGITFYDTADMYSQGESETLIGNAFHNKRDQVVLATKGGYCLPARRKLLSRIKPLVRPLVQALGITRAKLPSGASGALSQDFSPSYLTTAVEASLRRLRTDYIDLYQLHSPTPDFLQSDTFAEALETLDELKRQGKVRFYGIATEVPEDVPFCLSKAGISSVQLGFGLLDLEALEHGWLADAEARGLGVIVRGCFGGGLLKDTTDKEALKALTPKWERILKLRSLCLGASRPVLEAALQFSLSTPGAQVTLLGMRTEEHLSTILRYYDAPPLTRDEYQALRHCYQERQPVHQC